MQRSHRGTPEYVHSSMGPTGMQDKTLHARDDNKAWSAAERQNQRCEQLVGNLEVDNDELADTLLTAARMGHPVAIEWLSKLGVREQLGF